MRRKILITFGLVLTIISLSFSVNAEDIDSSNTEIKIVTTDNYYNVEETIILKGNSEDIIKNIGFWIHDGSQDVTISVNGENIDYEVSNSIYTTNLTDLEIKENSQPTVKITYRIDNDNYNKGIIRNTSSFKVTFDGDILQTSTNLISGTTINLNLYKQTAAESDFNLYLIIVIVILIFLLLIVLLSSSRKPKQKKVKKSIIESEELLSTKKTLLMSILKDVEKKHRAKDISDETYHKLKNHYKNEAIETMKKLEDMGSKI
jgi:hypothetical protein